MFDNLNYYLPAFGVIALLFVFIPALSNPKLSNLGLLPVAIR